MGKILHRIGTALLYLRYQREINRKEYENLHADFKITIPSAEHFFDDFDFYYKNNITTSELNTIKLDNIPPDRILEELLSVARKALVDALIENGEKSFRKRFWYV